MARKLAYALVLIDTDETEQDNVETILKQFQHAGALTRVDVKEVKYVDEEILDNSPACIYFP